MQPIDVSIFLSLLLLPQLFLPLTLKINEKIILTPLVRINFKKKTKNFTSSYLRKELASMLGVVLGRGGEVALFVYFFFFLSCQIILVRTLGNSYWDFQTPSHFISRKLRPSHKTEPRLIPQANSGRGSCGGDVRFRFSFPH